MDNDVLIHLKSNFNFTWDVENLVSKFLDDDIIPIQIKKLNIVYSDPAGRPHWQMFKSNISFLRNFVKNFYNEAKEIEERLKELQNEIKSNIDKFSKNELLTRFLNEKISFNSVNITRVYSQHDVKVHIDSTRSIAINIGLKNSNTHQTFISHDMNINNYTNSIKSSYILNDNDVFLISVKNPHSMTSLNKENNLVRYAITYNIF